MKYHRLGQSGLQLGAFNPQQLRDNPGAIDAFEKLTPGVAARIATILQSTPGLE